MIFPAVDQHICRARRYMWHDPGSIKGSKWIQPTEFWENSETKRRFHNLLDMSGLLDNLIRIRARRATRLEITRFHTEAYHDNIMRLSANEGGDAGELAPFATGGYDIANLSVGGALAATEAVIRGDVRNAYCLVRPPGHHAEAARGRGFCIFNNVALAALHARTIIDAPVKIQKIVIVDYDVHHGNGTQDCFWNDSDCLFISVHQDCNYPQDSGYLNEVGPVFPPCNDLASLVSSSPGSAGGGGAGREKSNTPLPHRTINIPLPPGSGTGAYADVFARIIIPAIDAFQPDLILVSSGFDASYTDMLGAMMLSSAAFGLMARQLCAAADRCCGGRIVFVHEGGYSKDYVPFCGVAVIEAMLGEEVLQQIQQPSSSSSINSDNSSSNLCVSYSDNNTRNNNNGRICYERVVDDCLDEVNSWGYQACQPHQAAVIDEVVQLHGLHLLPSFSSVVNSLDRLTHSPFSLPTGSTRTEATSTYKITSHLLPASASAPAELEVTSTMIKEDDDKVAEPAAIVAETALRIQNILNSMEDSVQRKAVYDLISY
mmetsp:Transcript_1526/g.2525  ORF Transcript_1526/g.2525 Transcript_1526/m.2525 type:complete len:545 (+) Transcript_1526:96-1730(+)